MGWCDGDMGGYGGMVAGMWMFGIAWLILIVVGLVAVLRLIGSGFSGRREAVGGGRDAALGLLRERYARGEIDATEYEERRRTLSSDDLVS